MILHDWPDANSKKILKQIRSSAQPSTKLVVCDFLVPYAVSNNDEFPEISGSELPPAPYPLLPNAGIISNHVVMADMQVFVNLLFSFRRCRS
jgi:hypothetical protein